MKRNARDIRDQLVRQGAINHEEIIAANGQRINRKVELDVVEKGSSLFRKIVGGLVDITRDFRPDVIVPVPTGANEYVPVMAEKMKHVAYVLMDKRGAGKEFYFQSSLMPRVLLPGARVVLVDDVFRTGSQLEKLSEMPEFGESEVVGASVIWRRDADPIDHPLKFPVNHIIHEHVPDWVDES